MRKRAGREERLRDDEEEEEGRQGYSGDALGKAEVKTDEEKDRERREQETGRVLRDETD